MPKKSTVSKLLLDHAKWALDHTLDGAPLSLLPTLASAKKLIEDQAKEIKRLKRLTKDRDKWKARCESAEKALADKCKGCENAGKRETNPCYYLDGNIWKIKLL